jgi:UDPglucose 6-dehydrogenase
MMKIGIIGYGFVGKAVASAYAPSEVLINDPTLSDSKTLTELKTQCRAIFVCVPTPQYHDGACDTTVLEDVLTQLSGYTGIVISKSTAPPSVYHYFETKKYSHLKFVHAPEFLTAANAEADYQFPTKIVIGCNGIDLRLEAAEVIITDKINYDRSTVQFCSVAEAAMFKYVANTMLAMKVVINNEFYSLCNSLGIKWDNVARIASTDVRLGNTHWQVPGPDGQLGFGGACFPKDTQAMAALAKFMNSDMSMLEAAIKKNKKLRN